NFDGRPDIQEYYERGVLVRRESDRNFNGQADLIEEFDVETRGQTRSVVDLDFDGTADLLVLFRDGQPVFSKRSGGASRQVTAARFAGAEPAATDLVPLTDPFASDTAVRATHAWPNDVRCAGLAPSGALPVARFAKVGRPSSSIGPVITDSPS